MTALFGFQPCGTHCAVKEKLGSGIPHESLSADVHVTFSIKLLRWIGVVRKWSNQADTILLKQLYSMSYSIKYKLHLGILAPEAMTMQLERITASLRPSSVQLRFPLYSAKRPQLSTCWAEGNQVACQNVV